jgi:hypothetical protein
MSRWIDRRCTVQCLLGAVGCVVVALSATQLGAAALPKKPPAPAPDLVQKHTAADTSRAQSVLPGLVDFGPGWSASAASVAESSLTCPGSRPRFPGVIETGAATSDSFQRSPTGPFVAGSAWLYKSTGDAATVWGKAVGPRLLGCFVQSVKQGSTNRVTFTIATTGAAPMPHLAERTAAYRVRATARSAGQTTNAYYVLIVLGARNGIAELTMARFGAPVSSATEVSLARMVARRLAALPDPGR